MGKYLRFFVALCMQIRCNLEVKRGIWKVGRDDFEQIFGGFRGQDGFFSCLLQVDGDPKLPKGMRMFADNVLEVNRKQFLQDRYAHT